MDVTDSNIDTSVVEKSFMSIIDTSSTTSGTVFPNPCHELVTVSGMAVSKISVYDMTGKPVFRWFVESKTDDSIMINVKSLKPSMYILVCETEDGSIVVSKFIKQ